MDYFYEPTQVMFADPDNEGEWLAGIAYKDEIICACCGGVFEIADVLEAVPEDEQAIFPYEDWADISTEICGNGFPEDFPILNAEDEDIYFDEDDALGFGDRVDEEEGEFETYSHFSFDVD